MVKEMAKKSFEKRKNLNVNRNLWINLIHTLTTVYSSMPALKPVLANAELGGNVRQEGGGGGFRLKPHIEDGFK